MSNALPRGSVVPDGDTPSPQTPGDVMQTDFVQRMQQAAEEARDARITRNRSFLEHVVPVLRREGVDIVEIDYEGYGDSGGIDHVELIQAPRKSDTPTACENRTDILHTPLPGVESTSAEWEGRLVTTDDTPRRVPTLENCIHDYAYDMLAHSYAGWEINDGSTGRIKINLREGTVRHDHSSRYTATEDFSTERDLRE